MERHDVSACLLHTPSRAESWCVQPFFFSKEEARVLDVFGPRIPVAGELLSQPALLGGEILRALRPVPR